MEYTVYTQSANGNKELVFYAFHSWWNLELMYILSIPSMQNTSKMLSILLELENVPYSSLYRETQRDTKCINSSWLPSRPNEQL